MNSLIEKSIHTSYGEKKIAVHVMDIRSLDFELDVMTVSAFYNDYHATPRTVIKALDDCGISVYGLSKNPEIDLRKNVHVWLSEEVSHAALQIKRIGCIELTPYRPEHDAWRDREAQILSTIQAYFHMLEIASLSGIKIETLGLPLLGTHNQGVSLDLILIPVLNECVHFLENNVQIKEIHIITIDQAMAYQFAKTLDQSYAFKRNDISSAPLQKVDTTPDEHPVIRTAPVQNASVFISYSSKDKAIADGLCSRFEKNGFKVWYAPRDIHTNDYATAIVKAIMESSHFVVILSKNSLKSNHVLNEIDVAFSELSRNIHFKPLRVDQEDLGAAFVYYLSRQHWMDAHVPPLEERLDEFVQKILTEE